MCADHLSDNPFLLAAQMELVVLRASLPRGTAVPPEVVVIAPRADVITNREAADILANLPKPLMCTAGTTAAGVLIVRCESLSGDLALQHQLDVRAWDGEWDANGGVRGQIPADGTPLLVCGRGESILVSRAAFEQWYRDYATSNDVGFAFQQPTADERTKGARYKMIVDWIERDPTKLPFPIDSLRP